MARPTSPVSGALLVADFQTAFASAAAADVATYEAERSENELMGQLAAVSGNHLLNPATLPLSNNYDISRISLDAHIKKVQAQQIKNMSSEQLQNLMEQANYNYRHKHVAVRVLMPDHQPIESVWLQPGLGYQNHPTTKHSATGTIEQVLLDKNALVLRPRWQQRIVNSRLKHYIVYIIDPQTLQPMVEVAIL